MMAPLLVGVWPVAESKLRRRLAKRLVPLGKKPGLVFSRITVRA